jgi:homoserine kinase type II
VKFQVMTPKNKISEKKLLEILQQYDFGRLKRYKLLTGGETQTTVLIETSKGKYILRSYDNRTVKHVLFEVHLFNYLKNNCFPVPGIIKTSKGGYYGTYKDKPFIVIEYIEGEHLKNPNEYFDKAQVSNVIEIIAQLHNLTSDYIHENFNDREVFNAGYAWREYQKKQRKVHREERAKWFKDELGKIELPESMPKSICHADLNYGNFLIRNGEIAAVLDFDMSFYTYTIYDIASLIYWWAFPPEMGFKERRASYIVNEYINHRALSETEKIHIYDSLKLTILLGISWSEECDFEYSKKAADYLNKLGRDGFYTKLFPH